MENRRGHGTPSRARAARTHRDLAHRSGVFRLSRSKRAAFRRLRVACATQPRVWRGYLLSLLYPEAERPSHLRGLHRHRLLHQGRAAIVEGHRAAPRHQARRDHAGRGVERADRALPGILRPRPSSGNGQCGPRQDRSRRYAGTHRERYPPMTIEELRKIAETEHDARKKFQHHVCVCIAAGCLSSGADHVRDALNKEVAESGMRNEVLVKGVGCMGLCSAGPLVTVEATVETAVETTVEAAVEPAAQMFASVAPEDAPEII